MGIRIPWSREVLRASGQSWRGFHIRNSNEFNMLRLFWNSCRCRRIDTVREQVKTEELYVFHTIRESSSHCSPRIRRPRMSCVHVFGQEEFSSFFLRAFFLVPDE